MYKRAESLQSARREVTSRSFPARRIRKGRAAWLRESTELLGRLSPKQRDTQITQQKVKKAKGKEEAK